MSGIKKILVLIFLILLGFILSLVFGGQDEKSKLNNLLSDVSIGKIKVDGKTYSIKNGRIEQNVNRETALKILKLAAFYQWNKEDPLFDSPDFEPEKLEKAIASLEEETDKFSKMWNQSIPLYPISFLKSFAQSAKFNRQFSDFPSFEDAQVLIKKQREASRNYKTHTQSLYDYVSNDPRLNKFVVFNIQMNSETMIKDLGTVSENADFILKEIDRREACLLGTGDCIRPALAFTEPRDVDLREPKPPEFLDPVLIHHGLIENPRGRVVKGPYRTTSPCFGWGKDFHEPEHYFYITESKTISVNLATDAFYRLVGHPEGREAETIVGAAERVYTQTSLPYLCENLLYVPKISETSLFIDKHKKNYFSNGSIFEGINADDDKVKDFFARAKEKESQFFGQKYPSYEGMARLSDYYAYAYRLFVENHNAPWAKDSSKRDELLLRSLKIKRMLGNFYKPINQFVIDTRLARIRESIRDTDASYHKYVYTTRNYYAFFYLPFSPSVWRSGETLEYIDRQMVKNALGVENVNLNYKEAIKHYSKEHIEKWYIDISQRIEELAEEEN